MLPLPSVSTTTGSGKAAPPVPPIDELAVWSHVIVDLEEDALDELGHSRRLPPAMLGGASIVCHTGATAPVAMNMSTKKPTASQASARSSLTGARSRP